MFLCRENFAMWRLLTIFVAQYSVQWLLLNEAEGHNAPSDHMIIAHAITEHLLLMSSDTKYSFYRNQRLELIEFEY